MFRLFYGFLLDIQDLGNELLGIEYCLTKIINELVKTNKELSEADIESLHLNKTCKVDLSSVETIARSVKNLIKPVLFKECFRQSKP
jgi:hypothetical protein